MCTRMPTRVARKAAKWIATEARETVTTQGRFVIAFSGGRTPWIMLGALAKEDVPWDKLHVVQVDERVAPRRSSGPKPHAFAHEPTGPHSAARRTNPCHAGRSARSGGRGRAVCPDSPENRRFAAGDRPGPTWASGSMGTRPLSCPAIRSSRWPTRTSQVTGPYQGRRRMTLTVPILNRARQILWLVTGADKASMFARLRNGDASIPAGRIRRERALALADQAAAELLEMH